MHASYVDSLARPGRGAGVFGPTLDMAVAEVVMDAEHLEEVKEEEQEYGYSCDTQAQDATDV
jgi:hypothetical protein